MSRAAVTERERPSTDADGRREALQLRSPGRASLDIQGYGQGGREPVLYTEM